MHHVTFKCIIATHSEIYWRDETILEVSRQRGGDPNDSICKPPGTDITGPLCLTVWYDTICVHTVAVIVGFIFSILILPLIGGLGCGCEFNLHVNAKRIQKHKVPRSWSRRHLWAAQHGCWKPFFVQEQQALLTTEPLLQSLTVIFK